MQAASPANMALQLRYALPALCLLGMFLFSITGITLNHAAQIEPAQIGRDEVAALTGRHHQYPDGVVIYLGTLFAPVQDRDEPGRGFTHKLGDVVRISTPGIGTLWSSPRNNGR